MLQELSIVDFAIIDRACLQLGPGMNAITGETGAGKSILLDALAAVLGSRISSDLVRTGSKSARVEAVFNLDGQQSPLLHAALQGAGVELDEERILILGREVQANGRSLSRVNGRTTTASQLAEIGATLVDIHGQSDHLAILRTSEQRLLLDRYGGLTDGRAEVARHAQRLRDLRLRLAKLTSTSREREQRLELLRFQAEEIEGAALLEDEDSRLSQEREVLLNADRLKADASLALVTLAGDDSNDVIVGASTLLRTVEKAISDLSSIDTEASHLREQATDLVVLAEDLGRVLRSYIDAVEADPNRLNDVEDRLGLIQSLKRKYGPTIPDVIAFGAAAQRQVEEETGGALSMDALLEEARDAENALRAAALRVSKGRSAAAQKLAQQVEESITDLKMGRATIAINVRRKPDPAGIGWEEDGHVTIVHFDETGVDDIEFLIAPNAGEALKPLSRIASGGETARIMLALKSILSDIDTTPTLVFDEIDVGVGGRSGQVVGEKLWGISTNHQVIVVTHLPQIAAFADAHFRISKAERDNRTISSIDELEDQDRVLELAAMLDGVPLSEGSIANARDMLQRSRTGSRSLSASSG